MDRLLDGDYWTVRAWVRGRVRLDEDLDRQFGPPPVLEEIRIVAALVALLCAAFLLA